MFSKGLHRDNHPSLQPENTYRDCINGVLDHNLSYITNELGNSLSDTISGTPIGRIQLSDKRTIIFSIDSSGNSEIGIFENNNYTTIINDSSLVDSEKLKFNLSNPVEGDYRINNLLETIIYWTDNLNAPRFLNIDNPGTFAFGISANLFSTLDSLPQMVLNAVNLSGGDLKSGAYQFAIAYVDGDETPTNYFYVSNPVYINDESSFTPVEEFDGCPNDSVTGKSIELGFSDLDNVNFAKLRIAIIKDGGVNLLDDIVLSGSTEAVTIDGNETLTPSSLEEVIIGGANYDRVKTMKQMDNHLFMGNLGGGGAIDLGYQRYANGITTTLIEEDIEDLLVDLDPDNGYAEGTVGYKNPIIAFDKKTFRRGEVYAFYISFVLKSGNETRAYHIPGREIVGIEGDLMNPVSPNVNYGDISNEAEQIVGDTVPNWKFLSIPDGTYGMGYWHNEDEVYPDTDDWQIWEVDGGIGQTTGETLAGENVRHHRFPDFYNSKFYDGYDVANTAKILGVQFGNIQIPDVIKDQVLGYKIYYAKRTSSNRIIMDQSFGIYGLFNNLESDSPYYSIGRARNAVGEDVIDNLLYLHPFSHLREQKKLQIDYIQAVAKISDVPSDFNLSPELYTAEEFPTLRRTIAVGFLPGFTDRVSATGLGFTADFDQSNGEEKYAVEVANSWRLGNQPKNYLWNLCRYRRNMYNSFFSQELVFTGYMQTDLEAATSDDVFGGDTYITLYGYKSNRQNSPSTPIHLHHGVMESDDLIGYRHEGTEPFQDYFPKSTWAEIIATETINSIDRNETNNWLGYNARYSEDNDIKPAFPIIDDDNVAFRYPSRIIRSKKDDGSNAGDPFRDFSDNDFKDLLKNRGELIKIQRVGNALIAHFERGIMRTKGREELVVGDTRAFLGAGDIFAVEPDELITTDDGYGGLQHPNTSIVTPVGYFFVDADAGKVFILGQGLDEISNRGMTNFFRTNLKKTLLEYGFNIEDDEYPLYDLHAIYDNDLGRIILTKRDWGLTQTSLDLLNQPTPLLKYGNGSFYKGVLTPEGDSSITWTSISITDRKYFEEVGWTISYNVKFGIWDSFHSYIPIFYFADINNLYSIYNGGIYRHNNIDANISSFYGTIKDFEFKFVNRDPSGISNQVMSLAFDTNVVNKKTTGEILNDTFDRFRITNGYQDSGEVTIIPHPLSGYNTRRVKRIWHVNSFRDTLTVPDDPKIPTHMYKKRLQDKYHVVHLKYGNSDDYILYFLNSHLQMKPAHR